MRPSTRVTLTNLTGTFDESILTVYRGLIWVETVVEERGSTGVDGELCVGACLSLTVLSNAIVRQIRGFRLDFGAKIR